jgi:hypothetical protein
VRRPGVCRCQRVSGGRGHATGAEPNRWTASVRDDAGEQAHSGSPSGWAGPSATGGSLVVAVTVGSDDAAAVELLLAAEDDEAELELLLLDVLVGVGDADADVDVGASLVDVGASLLVAGSSVSSPVSGT